MADALLTPEQLVNRLKGRKYKWAQVHHTYRPHHADFNGKNHQALQDGMRNYHVNTRGWQDIGQHVTLFPDGKFLTGRDFGIAPAGISGYNTGSFMIEILGDFDKGNDKLEGSQLESALKVYNFLINHCGATIMFHREHAPKTCPGTGIDKAKFLKAVKEQKPIDVSVSGGGSSVQPSKPASKPKTKWTKVNGSWTGQTLKHGQYGPPVKQMQTMLAKNKPPFYPNKGAKNNGIDSYYGDDTKDAVKRFQKYYGLTADGLAGKKTYAKLTGKKTSTKANLTVDGKWGKDVTRALQKRFGTPVDGIISKQPKNSVSQSLYGNTVQFGSGGSNVIVALQKHVGVKADGKLGPSTIKALQAHLGTTKDGVLSRPSLVVKAMQRKLNNGTF